MLIVTWMISYDNLHKNLILLDILKPPTNIENQIFEICNNWSDLPWSIDRIDLDPCVIQWKMIEKMAKMSEISIFFYQLNW